MENRVEFTVPENGFHVVGAITSDGHVIGSATCPCGWSVGPGAYLGPVQAVRQIKSHHNCPLD